MLGEILEWFCKNKIEASAILSITCWLKAVHMKQDKYPKKKLWEVVERNHDGKFQLKTLPQSLFDGTVLVNKGNTIRY